jgi:hypothetical protein
MKDGRKKEREGGCKLRRPKTKPRVEPKTKAKRLNNQILTKICEIGASSNSWKWRIFQKGRGGNFCGINPPHQPNLPVYCAQREVQSKMTMATGRHPVFTEKPGR